MDQNHHGYFYIMGINCKHIAYYGNYIKLDGHHLNIRVLRSRATRCASSFYPMPRSVQLSLVARLKLAIRFPDWVDVISGSFPRFLGEVETVKVGHLQRRVLALTADEFGADAGGGQRSPFGASAPRTSDPD